MSQNIPLHIRNEIRLKILVQQEQFFDWIRRFFYINKSLHKEFDSVYQQMYYVMLCQLLGEGLSYAQKAVETLQKTDNKYLSKWFETLVDCLLKIKSTFSEEELEYLEYKRHNACHIFQNHYEKIQDNGQIRTKRKNKDLTELEKKIATVLYKYGWDEGFDKHITTTLYPILTNLYEKLQEIHQEESKERD